MNVVPTQVLELFASAGHCQISVHNCCHLRSVCVTAVAAYQPLLEVLKTIAKAHAKDTFDRKPFSEVLSRL